MRFLTLAEVLRLHTDLIAGSGGGSRVRDLPRVESALAQPMATFDGSDLYPTLHDKAAALGYALIQGHPIIDGNKRIGHAAMEVFLILNGYQMWMCKSERFWRSHPAKWLAQSFATGCWRIPCLQLDN